MFIRSLFNQTGNNIVCKDESGSRSEVILYVFEKNEKKPFFVPPLFLDDYAIDSGVRRPVGKVFRRTFDSCTILVEWMLPKPLKIEITHHLVISTISKIVPVV